jgi:hypothetical protein
MAELLEWHAVGKALAADANALEHAIASKLLQHQDGIDFAWLKMGVNMRG